AARYRREYRAPGEFPARAGVAARPEAPAAAPLGPLRDRDRHHRRARDRVRCGPVRAQRRRRTAGSGRRRPCGRHPPRRRRDDHPTAPSTTTPSSTTTTTTSTTTTVPPTTTTTTPKLRKPGLGLLPQPVPTPVSLPAASSAPVFSRIPTTNKVIFLGIDDGIV